MGYSRAVVLDNDMVYMSGTTGFDYSTMEISDDIVEQTEQCWRNIAAALSEAGATIEDIVRVTYILPDASEFEKTWPVLKRVLETSRPTSTMFVAGLADPRMKIEIEVLAARKRG